jgi:hypothetical protein
MRNALNKLADTVKDPAEKKVSKPPKSTHLLPHDIPVKLPEPCPEFMADGRLGPMPLERR